MRQQVLVLHMLGSKIKETGRPVLANMQLHCRQQSALSKGHFVECMTMQARSSSGHASLAICLAMQACAEIVNWCPFACRGPWGFASWQLAINEANDCEPRHDHERWAIELVLIKQERV